MRRSLVIVLALIVLGVSTVAMAGDLYTLCGKVVTAEPAYPVDLQIDVHKGDKADDLKGTTTATFDGVMLDMVECDPVACITGAAVVNGMLEIYYCFEGYKDGKFESESFFDVFVGDVNLSLAMHTSCSKPIWINHPYGAYLYDGNDPVGMPLGYFEFTDGTGHDCDFFYHGECPPDPNKLMWFSGKFEVDCDAPADIIFNIYKDDDQLRATATAHFDGTGLVDVANDFSANLKNAVMVGDTMRIVFDAYGYKDWKEFESNSRFELIVENCGTFYLDLHTSCSQELTIGPPGYDMTPGGYFEIMNCCGECCGYVPVEDSTWGAIKSLYR